MVLAVCANGCYPGASRLFCWTVCGFSFTLIAVAAARKHQIARHREFMIRSYALTLSPSACGLGK